MLFDDTSITLCTIQAGGGGGVRQQPSYSQLQQQCFFDDNCTTLSTIQPGGGGRSHPTGSCNSVAFLATTTEQYTEINAHADNIMNFRNNIERNYNLG